MNRFKNLATGNLFTGDYSSKVTGPDLLSESALSFTAGLDGLTGPTVSMPTDFTIMFWIKDFNHPSLILQIGVFTLKINSSVKVEVYDGVDTVTGLKAYGSFTGWMMVAVVREGTNIKVYTNSNSIAIYSDTITIDVEDDDVLLAAISDTAQILPTHTSKLYDIRIYNTALSIETLQYYYDNVINNEGDIFRPGSI